MNTRWLRAWMLVPALGVVLLGGLTPVLSNAWQLLVDRSNFIPPESSIWTFEPTVINQGSSNYWLYGEDRQHYFYFSYAPETPYRLIGKDARCPGFNPRDVATWCTP